MDVSIFDFSIVSLYPDVPAQYVMVCVWENNKEGAAILNCELGVVKVPLTLWPKIPTSGGCLGWLSWPGKQDFWLPSILDCTIKLDRNRMYTSLELPVKITGFTGKYVQYIQNTLSITLCSIQMILNTLPSMLVELLSKCFLELFTIATGSYATPPMCLRVNMNLWTLGRDTRPPRASMIATNIHLFLYQWIWWTNNYGSASRATVGALKNWLWPVTSCFFSSWILFIHCGGFFCIFWLVQQLLNPKLTSPSRDNKKEP